MTANDRFYCLLAFLLGLAACWSHDPARAPIVFDNQIYFYVAERAAAGVPPHVSQFDPKNALSMLVTAVAIRAGHVFEVDPLYSARAVSVLVASLSVAMGWLVARRIANSEMAGHVAAAAMIIFPGFASLSALGARPKIFLVAALLVCMLAVERRRAVLAGAMGAACWLCWQPGLVALGAAGLVLWLGEGGLKAALRCGFAGLAVIAAYEAYFWFHGALEPQLYQSLVFPFEFPKPQFDRMRTVNDLFDWKNGVTPLSGVMTLALALLGLIVAAGLIKPRRAIEVVRRNPALAHVVLVAGIGIAFLLTDYQGFPDRLFVMPAVVILVGVAFGKALRTVERSSWSGVASTLVASLAFVGAYTIEQSAPHVHASYSLEAQRAAARQIGDLVAGGSSVYAMGPLHLLAMNGQSNASAYGFLPWRVRFFMMQEIMKDPDWLPVAEGDWPDVVLESRFSLPPLRRWLAAEYEQRNWPLFARQKIRVWTRPHAARMDADAQSGLE